MQEILSGKRIIKINNHWSNRYAYSLNDNWWKPSGVDYMAENKIENANWDMEIPTVSVLPEEAKLLKESEKEIYGGYHIYVESENSSDVISKIKTIK